MHLLVQKWALEHGEIIRVQLGPVTNHYLNSDKAVKVRFVLRKEDYIGVKVLIFGGIDG